MKLFMILSSLLFSFAVQADLQSQIEANRSQVRERFEKQAVQNLDQAVRKLGLSIRKIETKTPFRCEYTNQGFGDCDFQWWNHFYISLSDGRLCEVDLAMRRLTQAFENPTQLTGVAVCFKGGYVAPAFEFWSYFNDEIQGFKLNRVQTKNP